MDNAKSGSNSREINLIENGILMKLGGNQGWH